jgi:hypothetical protein
MGRVRARADLRDCDVWDPNPGKSLFGFPVHGLLTKSFGQHKGEHVHRKHDPASPQEGWGRKPNDPACDPDQCAAKSQGHRSGAHLKRDVPPRLPEVESARDQLSHGSSIDILAQF